MSKLQHMLRIVGVLAPLFLAACSGSSSAPQAVGTTPTGPNENPPAELACLGSQADTKQAFFGDLHIHTKLSFDAYFFNSINGPREAYRFAQGDDQFLPQGNNPDQPMRRINIGRPLDFAAVTEHAEQLGTFSNLCEVQGRLPAGTNPACNVFGQFIRDNVSTFITGNVPIYLQVVTSVGSNIPSTTTWQQIQAITEEQNSPCKFTTLHGYEFSSNKGGQVLHRNVIFANANVPADVVSSVPPIPTEDNTNDEWMLFDRLKAECLDVEGCDVLTIPHSMNQSDGRFVRPRQADTGLPLARNNQPLSNADSLLRNRLDRALEIVQHKGASECLTGFAEGLQGEESSGCGFEEWKTLCRGLPGDPAECKAICPGTPNDPLFCQVNQNTGSRNSVHAAQPCEASNIGGSTPDDCTSPLDYARNVIAEGVAMKNATGINPYQYGFIGSSDTHNGIAGRTDKTQWVQNTGHGGVLDDEPNEALGEWQCRPQPLPTDSITGFKLPLGVDDPSNPAQCNDRNFNPVASNFNPGGLAGVWARENTRSEIFAALKRRETFATSGSRMRIRMLASNSPFPADVCDMLARGKSPIEKGISQGVPMGGVLPAQATGPYMVAYAMQDPGGLEPGIPLQRLEIIKAWANANGERKQQRITLLENPSAPQPAPDCSLQLQGPEQMCAVFHDTDFNPSTGAAYYARALENPSCRWSTRMCMAQGVQCNVLDPANGQFPAQSGFAGYEGCCQISGEPGSYTGQFRMITQQERAWGSPVWVEGNSTPTTQAAR